MNQHKNIPDKVQNDWRSHVIFWVMVSMLAGLFLPRVVLSASTILFILVAFIHNQHREQFKKFFSDPLLLAMSVLFFIPLLSGLWSEDKEKWMDIIRNKLPLLFFPLAFAAPMKIGEARWIKLAWIFLIMVFAATAWSTWQYIKDYKAIEESYLRAKSILTPLEDDHIRFSWIVSTTALLSVWMLFIKAFYKNKTGRIILFILLTWFVIYLHMLSARTGLLTLYAMIFFASTWWVVKKAKFLSAALAIIALTALPVIAYLVFPTFRNRISYIKYDASFYSRSVYLEGTTDGNRYFSIKAGIDVLNAHPLTGVGFGDIRNETNGWFKQHVPQMLESDKLLPSSEWLIYGVGAGWPGLIIFTIIMFIPFFIKMQRFRLPWFLLNLSLFLSFIFDIGLEVQYGVFLFSFIILWWYKWINEPET